MSKKPRVKKNNNAERQYRLARAFTSAYAVAQVNDKACEVVDLSKNMKVRAVSRTLVTQLTDIKHKWTVLLCVACTESNGKHKLVTDQITFTDRKHQSELRDFLLTEHRLMADDCATKMTVNGLAWLATPMPDIDFQLEAVDHLLIELGI